MSQPHVHTQARVWDTRDSFAIYYSQYKAASQDAMVNFDNGECFPAQTKKYKTRCSNGEKLRLLQGWVGALKEKSTDKLPFPFFPFWAHECLQSKVG